MTILAQGGPERNPLFGDFPTFVEKGINYTSEFPYVVAFPKGTNPEILQKWGKLSKIQITLNTRRVTYFTATRTFLA